MRKNTKKDIELEAAGKQYAAAYAAHHMNKDLNKALALYKSVMAAHPNTKEARFAGSQIKKIVNTEAPQQNSLNAQMDAASAVFKKTE